MRKPMTQGAYAGQCLSFGVVGKSHQWNAKVANRTREIRPSGMKTGARGNVAHGGNVNPSRNRKGENGNPPAKSARAPVLSKRQRPTRPQSSRRKTCHVNYPIQTCSDATVRAGNCLSIAWCKRPSRPEGHGAFRGGRGPGV
jgi:hypothetical protein